MLIKLLSKEDASQLISLAWLFAIADKPLLCDGKVPRPGAVTYSKSSLSIEEGALERELLEDMKRSVGEPDILHQFGSSPEDKLLGAIGRSYAVDPNDEAFRLGVAVSVLNEMLHGINYLSPSTPKIMLFELCVVALRDGHISAIEMAMLKRFQAHHRLEDFIFDDLLERAEALSKEVSKTISICLE